VLVNLYVFIYLLQSRKNLNFSMESGLGAESDPRALLLPEAVPVLHSIISQGDDDSDSEDLPSTVDIAALKVCLLLT